MDSVHISLLTCSPHPEVYSLYGHTALRVQDTRSGMDVAVNYGMFSFDKPFFVLRFVFGLTDYEMGTVPFPLFLREYEYYGSSVTQQEFNLTAEEKAKILMALEQNARPENKVYRYNYFYDNCTTRARNIVEANISGKVVYQSKVPEGLTFRQMIHEMNSDYPWARLGNDLLLGIGADRQLTQTEMQFLPHSMLQCADSAYIVDGKGFKRPLILSEAEVLGEGLQESEASFPLTPIHCACIILIVTAGLTYIEWKKHRYFWWCDAVLFLCQGLCGLVLTAMIFSQHPTVSLNIQILMFNILPLIFGYKAIRNHNHWFWLLDTLLLCLMLTLSAAEVQWLDVSVKILAGSLLIRSVMKVKNRKVVQ